MLFTFRNILDNELKEPFTLAGSEKHDVITCSLVTDLQMDHRPTILLGTYGQELLAYRFVDESWCLSWQRSFSHPILALDYCDVTGDGVRELVTLTTRGVQILQVHINLRNFDSIICCYSVLNSAVNVKKTKRENRTIHFFSFRRTQENPKQRTLLSKVT